MLAADPALRPAATLSDQIAYRLQRDILERRIGLGDHLAQDELCARFGVSRTPIREALTRLAASSLVELRPNRGAIVRRPGRREIRELYELRAELEGFAAERAAARVDRSTMRRLERLQGELTELLREPPSSDAEADERAAFASALGAANDAIPRPRPRRRRQRALTEDVAAAAGRFPKDYVTEAPAAPTSCSPSTSTEHERDPRRARRRRRAAARRAMTDHVAHAATLLDRASRPRAVLGMTEPSATSLGGGARAPARSGSRPRSGWPPMARRSPRGPQPGRRPQQRLAMARARADRRLRSALSPAVQARAAARSCGSPSACPPGSASRWCSRRSPKNSRSSARCSPRPRTCSTRRASSPPRPRRSRCRSSPRPAPSRAVRRMALVSSGRPDGARRDRPGDRDRPGGPPSGSPPGRPPWASARSSCAATPRLRRQPAAVRAAARGVRARRRTGSATSPTSTRRSPPGSGRGGRRSVRSPRWTSRDSACTPPSPRASSPRCRIRRRSRRCSPAASAGRRRRSGGTRPARPL